MIHNDILRSLRFLLDVNDVGMANVFSLGGLEIPIGDVGAMMRKEDDPDFLECSDATLDRFLDGVVIHRRGRRETHGAAPSRAVGFVPVTNNTVLKKLRVAYELKDTDVIALMTEAGVRVSKPEISALFRSADHPNFRPCGDQFLRNFLRALTARVRS